MIGSLSKISSFTIIPLENLIPKSSWIIDLIHEKNCTYNGLSNPYISFNWVSDSSVILGFISPLAKKLLGAKLIAIKDINAYEPILKNEHYD